MAMSASNRKSKGKAFETKISNAIHEYLYESNQEYKTLFDNVGHDQIKPRRDSSSGTFNTSTGDIELGLAQGFFPFSVECKHWATLDLSLNAIMKGKTKSIVDVYEKQCVPVAKEKGLEPLVVFRANRTEDFCMTERALCVNSMVKIGKYYIYLFSDFLRSYENGK